MAKRELIYKDEARRTVLQNAAGIVWCIDRIKPVAVVDDGVTKVCAKTDEYWVARIGYWGEKPKVDIVYIFYAWENGEIDFIPCSGIDGDPVRASRCESFELLERVEVEKYK